MECHLNLEFLCRVCAANTKGKNSVAECVYILKTVGLRDKLDKFLYLKVFENDALPKVLCKSCYRQVEATASLSKIAKHTQQVFRDFLLSSLPKGTVSGIQSNSSDVPSINYGNKKDFGKAPGSEANLPLAPANSLAHVLKASAAKQSLVPPSQPMPMTNAGNVNNTTPRKDEVVVNVSVTDPLTRENQQKVISNSQRRHSIMVEAAELAAAAAAAGNDHHSNMYYVPQSIAQKHQRISGGGPNSNGLGVAGNVSGSGPGSSSNNRKSSSPARVMKFQPIAPKPLDQQLNKQQPNQVTTFSSGGYVITPAKEISTTVPITSGKNGETPQNKEDTTGVALPNSITTSIDNTILQQKRKNLVKALNNIKANNTGQVSLLKSSQQKQQQTDAVNGGATTKPPVLQEIMAQVPPELPSTIIIAAPKNKNTSSQKHDQMKDINITMTASPNNNSNNTSGGSQEKSPSATPALKPSFPEDIPLGRVIRDVDLLKLILKALKWPTNKQNIELQLQRLKNSRFTDIMSDSHLLQDTDLTQLLGPYLAPVLMAAQALQQHHQQQQQQQLQQQQQQQQQQRNNTQTQTQNPGGNHNGNNSSEGNRSASPSIKSNKNSVASKSNQKSNFLMGNLTNLDAANVDDINKAIPYKLPPETSVQLVPALPDETPSTGSGISSSSFTIPSVTVKRSISKDDKPSTTEAPAPKKPRKSTNSGITKHRDSIVISDEEDNLPLSVAKERAKANVNVVHNNNNNSNFPVDITNSGFLAQLNLLNSTALASHNKTNEALMSLLQKQKLTISKQNNQYLSRKHKSKKINLVPLSPSEFDALINIDEDIVLMEPVTTSLCTDYPKSLSEEEKQAKKETQNDINNALSHQSKIKHHNDVFMLPNAVKNQPHMITRPIIKRRKTVIHSVKGTTAAVGGNKQQSLLVNSITTQTSKTDVSDTQTETEKLIQQQSLLNDSTKNNKVKDNNLTTSTTDKVSEDLGKSQKPTESVHSSDNSPIKQKVEGGSVPPRRHLHKASLGQQLLEAIGLQKIKEGNNSKLQNTDESPTSSTTTTLPPAPPPTPIVSSTKQSVNQIRSALKKSLKLAQEQQELRNKELAATTTTVIQDADSTTKSSTIKEIVIEGKTEKSSDSSTTLVDVEEQIDKITLLKNQSSIDNTKEDLKANDLNEGTTSKSKKLTAARITDRRSSLPYSMSKNRLKLKQLDATIKEKKHQAKAKEQGKSHSSSAAANTQKVTSSSAAAPAEVKVEDVKEEEDEVVSIQSTSRRRVRKRYTDVETTKENNMEDNNETEVEQNKTEDKNHKMNEIELENELVSKREKEKTRSKDKDNKDDVKEHKEKQKHEPHDNEKNNKAQGEHNKEGAEENASTSGRPTRQSKTLSKYYKGPEKASAERRSLPARSTRNRKYN